MVPTSLTWRNPPSNPPGSYLSSGGGPRRRRRAPAGAAAAAQGAAGIPRTAGWDGRLEPRFSPRGGKACGSGGLPGDVPPTVALGSPRFRARAGHRVRPSALPAPERSGMPEKNLAAESRSPRDRSATPSSRPSRGRPRLPPTRPRSPWKKAEDAGRGAPLLPGPSLRGGIRSPAQIPAAGPLPGRGRARGQAEESSTCHFGRL